MKVIFVDLDNISFLGDTLNIDILEKRLKRITNIGANKYIYYCNTKTQEFIKKNNIIIDGKLIVVKTKKDEADHKIIYDVLKINRKKKAKLDIISNDKIFLRLAMFMFPGKENINLYQFKKTKLVESTEDMNICFTKKNDLTKFIESYNLLKQRYLL